MDPQQRIALSVAFEALEHAGLVPETLRERRVGVYVGASSDDFRRVQSAASVPIGPYTGTGAIPSVISGRIAYVLGTRGPTLTIDTACSSSLVATHLAVRALAGGEAEIALVGGVSLMLSPEVSAYFGAIRAISPTGQCRPFEDSADGYVRGEGCVFLVLAPLSVAKRDGLKVHAILSGTAINHDGRSAGLTAPSGPAQEAVLRAALEDAGRTADAIDYVEAHGTGTPLGDPIEVNALGRVFVQRGTEPKVAIGSAKANVGHLEAAAGLVGVLKVVLALGTERLPAQPDFGAPSTKMRWPALGIEVMRAPRAWPRDPARPRVAGVSSFGLSGTNAHVIIEEAPLPDVARTAQSTLEVHDGLAPLALSARDPDSLAVLAQRVVRLLEDERTDLAAAVAHAAHRRSHHMHRLAVIAKDREAIVKSLRSLGSEDVHGLVLGRTRSQKPVRPVFVFSGQGTQWVGMARVLARRSATFREALESCRRAFAPLTALDPIGAMLDSSEPLVRISEIQPAIFAVQVALAALLRVLGVEPRGVVGHSMGEVAAAHVAGVLALEDAARVIVIRSALVETTRGHGTMAAVELSHDALTEAIARHGARIDIAAINSPSMCLVAGAVRAVERFVAALERDGVFARRLAVDYASHSAAMDALLPTLVERLGVIASSEPTIPMWSAVTGANIVAGELDATYWSTNLRAPVRFTDAVHASFGEGFDTFIELSPHPSIIQGVDAMLVAQGISGFACGTLRRESDDIDELRRLLGDLWVRGASIRFDRITDTGAWCDAFPTTPFRKDRFPLPKATLRAPSSDQADTPSSARSLRIEAASLEGHRVLGRAIAPATTYVELAFEHLGPEANTLASLTLEAPLDVASGEVDVTVTREGEDLVLAHGGTRLASVRGTTQRAVRSRRISLAPEGARIAAEALYARLERSGLVYGPRFALVREAWATESRVLARVELRDTHALGFARCLDACLHATSLLVPDDGVCRVPVRIERVLRLTAQLPTSLLCVARRGAKAGAFDIDVCDATGNVLVALEGLELHVLAGEARAPSTLSVVYEPIDAGTFAVHPPGLIVRVDRLTEELAFGPVGKAIGAIAMRVIETLRTAAESDSSSPVWIVTRGAFANHADDAGTLVQASIRGLVRSVSREHPELRCTLLDLDADETNDELAIARAARLGCPGDELRFTGSVLERATLAPTVEAPTRGREAFSLRIPTPGVTSDLVVASAQRRAPGRREIEVEVFAAGINFRDVLLSLRVIPDGSRRLGDEPLLGCEIAGIVVRVGQDADRSLLGRRVMGIAFGAMGSHVVTDARLVIQIPDALDTDVAAGQPVAHLTARHALDEVARIRAGESVLVHSAAGAVGLAAVEHCVRRGCRVIATASTEAKRAMLLARGAHAVADSRSLAFVDAVRAATDGAGVDVVLSSLSGEATTASLALLRDFGRFVELGQRDAYEGHTLPIRPFLRNLTYGIVDLVELARREPESIARMLATISDDLTRDASLLVPTYSHPVKDAADVFAKMARGEHTGKQVLDLRSIAADAHALPAEAIRVRPDGAYLVTGGLGAIGLAIAERLLGQGASHIVLVGRTAPSSAVRVALDGFRAKGARVDVCLLDVGDADAVGSLFERIESEATLRGIVHAAGILEDRVAFAIDAPSLERVLRPKIDAAIHLDRFARGCDPDFFVVLSSAAGILGSPGQAAYGAANAALDAFVAQRRALGLPALSVAFGPIAEVGLAAADTRRGARLAMLGMRSLDVGVALDAMFAQRDTSPGVVAIIEADFARLAASLGDPSLLRALAKGANASVAPSAPAHDDNAFVASLRALDTADAKRRLREHVVTLLAQTLRADASAIDVTIPMQSLGLDSMMALELKNRLQSALGLVLAATVVFRHPTIDKLAEHLAERLDLTEARPAPRAIAIDAKREEALDTLSTDELQDLLSAELGELANA